MKTDHLITVLSTDTKPGRHAALAPVLLATSALVALLFLPLLGLRPDALTALTRWPTLIKQGFPLLLAATAFAAVTRLSRPAARLGGLAVALCAVPALLAAAVVATLIALPPADWPAAALGQSALFCLTAIPLMSLAPLGASLWALRDGASTRPALTGAAAGLLAGGAGTAIYAIHCAEDSPLFYATWYGLAILIVTALGAVLGRRLLRW